MSKQLSWKDLQEIKRKDQEEVLEAWKRGELSDGSEYSDEEKQAMIEDSIKVEWEPGHLNFEYDPWVEEMMEGYDKPDNSKIKSSPGIEGMKR